MKYFILICGFLSAFPSFAATLNSQGRAFLLHEARSPQALEKGLMNVRNLGPYSGMLFIFPQPRIVRFWMKNTPLSLDMIFLDDHKKIIYLHERSQPFSLDIITCNTPIKWVIELKAGMIQMLTLKAGHEVDISLDAISTL